MRSERLLAAQRMPVRHVFVPYPLACLPDRLHRHRFQLRQSVIDLLACRPVCPIKTGVVSTTLRCACVASAWAKPSNSSLFSYFFPASIRSLLPGAFHSRFSHSIFASSVRLSAQNPLTISMASPSSVRVSSRPLTISFPGYCFVHPDPSCSWSGKTIALQTSPYIISNPVPAGQSLFCEKRFSFGRNPLLDHLHYSHASVLML